MNADEVRLVQASAARVAPVLEDVSRDVYERLFSAHPELRPMFPSSTADLERKLAASIAALVAAVTDFGVFTARTGRLGAVHAAHRVGPAHYAALAPALLDALAAADPAWDDATRDAWSSTYDLVAESMLLAARAARSRG